MSDYARANTGGATHFTDKDALNTGDSAKLIVGSQVDAEFEALVTAVATKYDSADLATQAQAEAESSNTVLITPLRLANWADENGGLVGELQEIADQAADGLVGWDDSASANANVIMYTAGTALSFNGTTIEVSHLGLEDLADPGGDRILFWDDSAGKTDWLTLTGLTVSTLDLAVDAATTSAAGKAELATSDETITGTDTARVVTPAGLAAKVGVTKVKTSNQSKASDTSMVEDDDLKDWSLTAAKYYSIEAFIEYLQTVGDIKFEFDFSNAPQGSGGMIVATDDNAVERMDFQTALTVNWAITTLTDGSQAGIMISGWLQSNATTGGTMDFIWAQNTSSANNTTVAGGSWIRVVQLN